MTLKLEDLIGETVGFQAVSGDRFYPAIIVAIYPDGRADIVTLGAFGGGTWLQMSIAFGKKGHPGKWFLRTPQLEHFRELFKVKEEVKKPDESIFADEAKPDTGTKPESVAEEPVRKSAVKSSRL